MATGSSEMTVGDVLGSRIVKWILAIIVVYFVATRFVGCTYVKPGYVGIKVDLFGSRRGVQDIPIVTGRVLYNHWTTQVTTFPIFMQSREWEGPQAITFTSLDRIPVTVDVNAAYRFEADKIPYLFVKYKTDVDTIADTYIHSRIRDAFVQEGAKQTAMALMGGGIATLDKDVLDHVNGELAKEGMLFDYVSVMGRPSVDKSIADAITHTVESTQQAAAQNNMVAVKKAMADQLIAEAVGTAGAARTNAQGAADAILLKAQAQAKANQLLAASLTPELIQLKWVEQWKGNVPAWQTGSGSAVPFVNMKPPGQ